MDIKNVVRNIIPLAVGSAKAQKGPEKTDSKTDANNDREGNGQAAGEEQQRRKLSEAEIEDAVSYLRELPGIKDNNLTVRLETKNDITVVLIVDSLGKVVRRIPEIELGMLTANREKKSGHLFNRAM